MTFEGALIKEQGVTFAIVVVRESIVSNNFAANKAISSFGTVFPGKPVVLMAQNFHGTPTYYGRHDIVNFLKNVPFQCIPWKRFTI